MNTVVKGFATALLMGCFSASYAAPIFQTNAVVGAVSNTATFDVITVGSSINLNGYTEDGIIVSVDDFGWHSFDPFDNGSNDQFHYGISGNASWVEISMQDGSAIYELDFLLGDGHAAPLTNLIWETFIGSTSTGFGDVIMPDGTAVRWTDSVGFTMLRVAAGPWNGFAYQGLDAFGDYGSIALDDVRVNTANVPEPSALSLLCLCLVGVYARRRTQQAAAT